MPVQHIVMFGFKADAKPDQVRETCAKMLALKDGCLHPTTSKSYITAMTGGKNMSIEGRENGITHAFIVEFDTVADRDYYVKEDKVHHDFVNKYILSSDAAVEKAQVIDYVPGEL